MSKLAIHGGTPVRSKPFPPYISLDGNEERAVQEVIRDGLISDFVGAKSDYFLGGKRVRKVEEMWCQHTGSNHAVSMNSATSVVVAAMGAFGVGPGDEVIVTPYNPIQPRDFCHGAPALRRRPHLRRLRAGDWLHVGRQHRPLHHAAY